jgi:hypothetical protein
MQIDPENICVVGSAVFAINDIRPNNDIEFIVRPGCASREINPKKRKWNQVSLSNKVDVFFNFYGFLGISDSDVFEKHLYVEKNGLKFADIRLQYLYKKELIDLIGRQKDYDDLQLLDGVLDHSSLSEFCSKVRFDKTLIKKAKRDYRLYMMLYKIRRLFKR